jgi:acyl carrier protein
VSTEDRVRRFIATELHWHGPVEDLTDDLPIIDDQVVDSMGIFQIVTFLEREFGIEILDEQLVPEHFGTIAGIARLVEANRDGDGGSR